ncbi:hypothetical protein Gohar_002682 [Gossypium harknessii]|uniref:RNase H type-1 domain-containing protein n=1 Tax=Gossypium harknessii TaxID=34285 RepID=A0A7J9HLJ7_9ROSI|nr:hypothetical protein [Gossypium harknessii]
MVIRNLQASEENYSEMRPITWDVKTLARGFASCRFEFVAREGNTTMHEMLSEGMKHSEDSFSVKDAQLRVLELWI